MGRQKARQLRPQERINKEATKIKGGLFGTTGFTALDYNGKPIIMDEKCTSGAFIAVNEAFVDWYGLPFFNAKPVAYKSQIEGNDYDAPIGLGFSWTDWDISSSLKEILPVPNKIPLASFLGIPRSITARAKSNKTLVSI